MPILASWGVLRRCSKSWSWPWVFFKPSPVRLAHFASPTTFVPPNLANMSGDLSPMSISWTSKIKAFNWESGAFTIPSTSPCSLYSSGVMVGNSPLNHSLKLVAICFDEDLGAVMRNRKTSQLGNSFRTLFAYDETVSGFDRVLSTRYSGSSNFRFSRKYMTAGDEIVGSAQGTVFS